MRSENAAWHRRMPWKLIGFGSAFIGALFAWHFTREAPNAIADGRLLSAHTTLDAAEPAGEEEPTIVAEAPRPRRRAADRKQADPGLDVTVIVEGEDTVIEEETYVETVAAPEPHRVVIVVQQSAPAPQARKSYIGRGGSYGGRVPGGGSFTPRNPRVPSGPLTPRTNRSPRPPRAQARPPRRRSPTGGRMGSGTPSNRRRGTIRRR